MITHLPEKISNPILTAELEQMLDEVSIGKLTLDSVLRQQGYFLAETLEELFKTNKSLIQSKTNAAENNEKNHRCEKCRNPLVRRKNHQKESYFWGCSKYPACKFTAQDLKGKPVF